MVTAVEKKEKELKELLNLEVNEEDQEWHTSLGRMGYKIVEDKETGSKFVEVHSLDVRSPSPVVELGGDVQRSKDHTYYIVPYKNSLKETMVDFYEQMYKRIYGRKLRVG